MCGIAGAYQQVDGEEATETMGRCLDHRGPDEEGSFSYTDERVDVHFAHRRLSIIDLRHGQQPLVKRPFALCYNGELYNYREIRAELAAERCRASPPPLTPRSSSRHGDAGDPDACEGSGACSPSLCSTKRPAPSSSPATSSGSSPCTTSGARTVSCSLPSSRRW